MWVRRRLDEAVGKWVDGCRYRWVDVQETGVGVRVCGCRRVGVNVCEIGVRGLVEACGCVWMGG